MGVLKYMFYAPNLEQKTSRSTSDTILQLEISQSTSSLLIVFYVESNFLVGGTIAYCEVILSQKQVFGKNLLLFLSSIAAHASVSTTHVRILHVPLCHFIVSLLRLSPY
jgi:hypothetical protein